MKINFKKISIFSLICIVGLCVFYFFYNRDTKVVSSDLISYNYDIKSTLNDYSFWDMRSDTFGIILPYKDNIKINKYDIKGDECNFTINIPINKNFIISFFKPYFDGYEWVSAIEESNNQDIKLLRDYTVVVKNEPISLIKGNVDTHLAKRGGSDLRYCFDFQAINKGKHKLVFKRIDKKHNKILTTVNIYINVK